MFGKGYKCNVEESCQVLIPGLEGGVAGGGRKRQNCENGTEDSRE